MNEGQFKAVVKQFAAIQAVVWKIVESYSDDASSEEVGPLRMQAKRLRNLQLELAKFEGMIDEAGAQVQFLINLREQASAKPTK